MLQKQTACVIQEALGLRLNAINLQEIGRVDNVRLITLVIFIHKRVCCDGFWNFTLGGNGTRRLHEFAQGLRLCDIFMRVVM